jgi:pyruvate formate lyase activating enzyme
MSAGDLGPDRIERESLLQEQRDGKVRCHVCERRCTLPPGGLGWCRTRANRAGRLLTLVYGAVSALAADPIEKKPFYHFHPGTWTFTAGGWSCNFACPWCQNWQISRVPPPRQWQALPPEEFIRLAQADGCRGVSISYNEPTLSLEWSAEVFRLARARGLYTAFVTNGYLTAEALQLLIEAGLDAMNVDVKGTARAVRHWCQGVEVDKVWALSRLARSLGVHVEITTLVIPTVNDAEADLREIAGRVATELGPETPWHVTAYFPAYQFNAPPTSARTLERAWEIGQLTGLEFVYVGNLAGHHYDNTYCPACGELLLERHGFAIQANSLRNGRCTRCNRRIAGRWESGQPESA